MSQILENKKIDLILLIGFMRILSPGFVDRWGGKIINVHPSLLPKYAGGMNNDVHESVLAAGDKETGCTIHLVTKEVDGRPILLQKSCPVFDNDSVESLKERVQELVGKAFIAVINKKVDIHSKLSLKKLKTILLISFVIFLTKNITRLHKELNIDQNSNHNFVNFPFYWIDKTAYEKKYINPARFSNVQLNSISKNLLSSNSGEAIIIQRNISKGIVLRGYTQKDFSKLDIINDEGFVGDRNNLKKIIYQ